MVIPAFLPVCCEFLTFDFLTFFRTCNFGFFVKLLRNFQVLRSHNEVDRRVSTDTKVKKFWQETKGNQKKLKRPKNTYVE